MGELLDNIIANFDPTSASEKERVHDGKPLTVWVPLEYKEKFDLIQAKCGRKFSKTLREIIKSAIDRVHIDEAV